MRARPYAVFVFFLLASMAAAAAAQPQPARRTDAGPLPSIEERTAGLKKLDGYFPLYWDERTGQLWMEVSRIGTEVLHSTGFGAGLGSNDIGVDRGALSGSRIVVFERVGPKVLMVAPNLQFRAVGAGAAETRTVKDAFARSVLWAFRPPPSRLAACWSTPPSSSCATRPTSRSDCAPAAIASTRRAVRSTCR